jgi:uncharacterized protein (TIGR03435 family)
MCSVGLLTLCSFLGSCAVSGMMYPQSTASTANGKPTFDAVSIRQIESYKQINSPGSVGYVYTLHKPCVYSEDKVLCQLSLDELIREAYQRRKYEITGPEWLAKDVFVFQAILKEKASQDDARLMIQAAIEDRFDLNFHTEHTLIKAYVMLAAPSGLHLVPADPPDRQKKIVVNNGPASYVTSSVGKFAAVAIRLDDLGRWVQRIADLDAPVLNGTGLDGQYKLELDWNLSDNTDSLSSHNDNGIVDALKKQSGLILRRQDVPVEMLVIDHINRTPTPN